MKPIPGLRLSKEMTEKFISEKGLNMRSFAAIVRAREIILLMPFSWSWPRASREAMQATDILDVSWELLLRDRHNFFTGKTHMIFKKAILFLFFHKFLM